MTKPGEIKAVFFDAGGTLFHPHPSVGHVYAATARKYGKKISVSDIDRAFYRIWRKKGGMASLGKNASPVTEKAWWRARVQEVFSSFGGVEPFEPFFEELFHIFGSAKTWRLYPRAKTILKKLRQQDYKLAIVSNWDHRLFGICRGLGLENMVDAVVASGHVGVSKPHKDIFNVALRKLRLKPSEALHVGDLLHEDYHGARRAGLHALWLSHGQPIPRGARAIKKLEGVVSFLESPRPYRLPARNSTRKER